MLRQILDDQLRRRRKQSDDPHWQHVRSRIFRWRRTLGLPAECLQVIARRGFGLIYPHQVRPAYCGIWTILEEIHQKQKCVVCRPR